MFTLRLSVPEYAHGLMATFGNPKRVDHYQEGTPRPFRRPNSIGRRGMVGQRLRAEMPWRYRHFWACFATGRVA